jgi:DeoR family transcriptional regulator, suf operon transcriptional repressor
MKSTREEILRTLLTHPDSTIKDLSEALGINGISIRHHLSALEEADMIVSAEERHGVGRPRLIYSLTDKGAEQFPTSYLKLTRRLLSALEENFSEEDLAGLFQHIGKEIANNYGISSQDQTPEARLDTLQAILEAEGFIAEWEKEDSVYQLISRSCPYYQIGLDHPQVCHLNHALISSFFPDQLKVTACIFQGDDHCVYEINPNFTKEDSYE